MMNNSKIGVALVGGYVLGRTKKAKLAIGLGMFLAGKKLNFDPKQLGSMLTDSKLLGGLNEQIRKELVDTTKSAATSALTNRIGGFADSLHKRTLQLDGGGEESEADEDDDRDYEDEDDRDRDDRDDDGAEAGESDTEEKPKAARAARKPPPSSSKTASSTRTRVSEETGKAASGGRKTASSARKATSGARKSTSGARKTASGAKKTASGTTRKASNRGGGNA